jgi:small-conductance mechanosensitive channel
MGEDHYTNREVLIPNSFVYSSPVFTISPKRSLVWDEVKVLLPAQTDHLLAKDLITQVGNSIAGPIMRKYRQEMIKNSSSSENVPSMPSLMLSFEQEGLMIILTYFCPISERNEVRTAISESILKEFRKEGIDIAFKDSQT